MPAANPPAAQPHTDRQRLMRVARGQEPGDLLLRGAQVMQPASREIFEADVVIAAGRIAAFGPGYEAARTVDARGAYLAPGFMDAHIHIESSLLTPAAFAAAVLPHGTTSVVAEPHEIVNVLGAAGLEWMLRAGQHSGLRVYASVPSCVPASEFEDGGATLSAPEIARLLEVPGVLGLAEMMNYPGVLGTDPGVWAILDTGRKSGRRLDGHAPGLSGRDLLAYAAAGLHSDHEATTPAEARARLRAGLWLMVREGSAARNLEALLPVLRERPRRAMLVSDDVSVDELLSLGHLDRLLRLCVAGGLHPLDALALVTCNPAEYWGLHDLGLVAPGYHADFVLLDNLTDFRVLETFVAGQEAQAGQRTPALEGGGVQLGAGWAQATLDVPASWPVMRVFPDQIITEKAPASTGDAKLVVADRYGRGQYASCWTSGTGLRGGTLGISVLHDAHNAAFLGGSDDDIRRAGHLLEEQGGGVVVVAGGELLASLPLPYAGLMTSQPPPQAAAALQAVTAALQGLGCTLPYPVTTLSFLGLSVIPALKLTPRGLLDVTAWGYVSPGCPVAPAAVPSWDMTQHTPVTIQVAGYGEIQARSGERLVLALERGGVDILHRCGGVARCTTCRVSFQEGEPDAMTVAEFDKLSEKGLLDSARLSCQIECAEGMKLTPLQTAGATGLEAGKAPTEDLQPEPQWTTRPGASTEG